MTDQQNKKAIVGMSGGVDSSVAAALLLRAGYEVTGVFMKNWSDRHEGNLANSNDKMCSWRKERADAQAVADQLGISLITLDFEEDYRREVYAYLLAEYEAGRTPNPDVLCNEKVKFGSFLQQALEMGADIVATGHYVRIKKNQAVCQLLAAVDTNKDQSYFLHRLSQEQLRLVVFPLGELTKPEVRALARDLKLSVADKKDSVGICFVGEVKMDEFLGRAIAGHPGPIISTTGRVVGRHRGLAPYTIGQRHGLGLGDGTPYFVVGKDVMRNTLIVAAGENPPELYSDQLIASNIHWISGDEPKFPLRCLARIRYRQPLQTCQVQKLEDNSLSVIFDQPQRSITPGQFVVFYDGEVCLGGGAIE
ncbi:tRNA 2-thiouridine(34) synthase MnmA [Patescibacteria group bacterium]|nr:tRNA 2-thiouridine(34) synthase MnmA [Patescibacteria group bacterium]MBU1029363.1 tRNA 2-thiouridine(34) synthase MnmA [Patescibacteria group bacterium]MBU1915576.1 tRNA 2-thiouridine(34) synthase MnmA [Patescibacteria group bacterium]